MDDTATVYIWYPHDSQIGHAAMFIGTPQVGVNFEDLSFAGKRSGMRIDRGFGPELHYLQNYVSWWPDDSKELNSAPSERKWTLADDMSDDGEGREPSVTYRLNGVNNAAMQAEWQDIRQKQKSNWKLLRKNCSTIVYRVLKAGGAMSHMSLAKRVWFANNLYLTPKNIAQICNDLRDNGYATKARSGSYEDKSEASTFDRVMNFR